MANIFKTPSVYLNLKEVTNNTAKVPSNFIGAFMGTASRGVVNKPILITSWNEYVEKFALGLNSPFLNDSYLAHAIYGYFQNGGGYCYVERVAGTGAAQASLTITGKTGVIKAKEPGVWGNSLKVEIKANSTNWDVIVKMGTNVVETFTALTDTNTSPNYWVKKLNDNSQYICAVAGTIGATAETALAGGSDGAAVTDDSFAGNTTSAIKAFDLIDFNCVVALCIPGKVTSDLASDVIDYCKTRNNMFAVFDCTETATISDVTTFRNALDSELGVVYYPWIKVVNPLSATGDLMNCPTCGHILGLYSRIFEESGIWSIPSGTKAILRGAIDVATYLTDTEVGNLNDIHVNSILSKSNFGIVAWGARTLTKDDDNKMLYISNMSLYLHIKQSIYNLTLPYVFSFNDESTWNKVASTIESFLNPLWSSGGLKGAKASEAYFVKCDSTTNTKTTIKQGKLICEIGYASNTPAEFIIINISQDMSN